MEVGVVVEPVLEMGRSGLGVSALHAATFVLVAPVRVARSSHSRIMPGLVAARSDVTSPSMERDSAAADYHVQTTVQQLDIALIEAPVT
jgi:hypothetical protein